MASDLVPILQAISPFASAGVAAVAIAATWLQGRRNIELNERQRGIDEAKLRSELFDKRYEAWASLNKYTWERINDIDDPQGDGLSLASSFEEAADRMFFLFGDDVNQAIDELDSAISEFYKVTKRQREVLGERAPYVGGEMHGAEKECSRVFERLKALIRKYMELAPVETNVAPKRWRWFNQRHRRAAD